MTISAPVHHVLWTSGWDSTFRILDLVFREKANVQPIYVFDPARRSSPLEVATMEKLRGLVAERNSEAGTRLAPVRIFDLRDLTIDPKFERAFEAARKGRHLGGQYVWLAQLAEDLDLKQLELCIHHDDTLNTLRNANESRDAEDEGEAAFLFERFAFPIIGVTKLDMIGRLEKFGVEDLLEETWFCHHPDSRNRPCGRCNPCIYTIQEGLGRRVPWRNRLLYWRNRLLSPIRPLVRRLRGKSA